MPLGGSFQGSYATVAARLPSGQTVTRPLSPMVASRSLSSYAHVSPSARTLSRTGTAPVSTLPNSQVSPASLARSASAAIQGPRYIGSIGDERTGGYVDPVL